MCEQSIGEFTSKVRCDSIRLPSIQCAVETSTPATLVRDSAMACFMTLPPGENGAPAGSAQLYLNVR
jgi:hypothetical protein